ncbi:hypothetical protein F5I97DRAFT_1847016 [Phlebopus sp. FC_14]|nr:hypothetical protein F5I97DRAFT_1847016 [Phlebopus sp. FC_14]
MVAASTAKKSTAKAAPGAISTEKAAPRSHHPTHPSWIDMITECITATEDGTRHGVSRPTIKKFVDSKYRLPMNAAGASQLNRAITHGASKGYFVLPKGPSGKVKLAPKKLSEPMKENTKPSSKHSTIAKAGHVPITKPTVKKPLVTASKAKIVKGETATYKLAATVKKYTSTAKKARASTTRRKSRGGRSAARGGCFKKVRDT